MEQGLRDCCRSIRIGKILVHTDEDTHDAKVVYAKLPPDIANRKVLLMYPIMSKYHMSSVKNRSFPLPNQSQKSRSILQDGYRFLGLFRKS